MPPRDSIIFVDAVAIKGAHELGCWNALRNAYRLHTVTKCLEEVTRLDKKRKQLVNRTQQEITNEVTVGAVTDLMRATVILRLGHRTDLDEGERDLLAYALSTSGAIWWLCGPDNGSVNALHILGLLDRMVSLQTIARTAGHSAKSFPKQYTDAWLSERRTLFLLEGL